MYFIIVTFQAPCKSGVGSGRPLCMVRMMADKALTVLGYPIMYYRVMPDGHAM
ncbi:hypothetical protein [Desulfocicer niacini]